MALLLVRVSRPNVAILEGFRRIVGSRINVAQNKTPARINKRAFGFQ
jgi:hypothetical protein